MKDTDRAICVAIHGWWGSGKTWLAHTLPGPRLALDTENGSWDTADREGRKVNIQVWNPITEGVPMGLTPNDTVIVNIRDLNALRKVMMVLESGKHQFESVILDSFHELQAMMKTQIANPGHEYDPNDKFDWDAWGRLKNHGGLLLRDLRDLTWPDSAKRVNVAVVIGSDSEAIPAVPLVEGGTRKQLAGWFDVVGFLFTHINEETKEEIRVLQVAKDHRAEAKCRLHAVKRHYGAFIEHPDLTEILAVLNKENSNG